MLNSVFRATIIEVVSSGNIIILVALCFLRQSFFFLLILPRIIFGYAKIFMITMASNICDFKNYKMYMWLPYVDEKSSCAINDNIIQVLRMQTKKNNIRKPAKWRNACFNHHFIIFWIFEVCICNIVGGKFNPVFIFYITKRDKGLHV